MTNRTLRLVPLVLAAGLIASACGDASADELAALQMESSEAITQLETDLEDRYETITQLNADLETVETETTEEISALTSEVATLTASLEDVEAERDEAIAAASDAEAREQELLNTYDPEIRAAAQVAWDAELASACAEAGDGSGAIASFVTHTDEMTAIGTRSELIDAVTACAQPLRERSAEEKLNADCAIGDPDALTRGTSAFVGDCLVMFAIPFQWDSRTGECAFLARWDGANRGTRSFRYDGDGLSQAGSTVCTNGLEGADQDDLLKLWVEVVGTYTYDTAAGGTNAVPQLTIVKAELVSKA